MRDHSGKQKRRKQQQPETAPGARDRIAEQTGAAQWSNLRSTCKVGGGWGAWRQWVEGKWVGRRTRTDGCMQMDAARTVPTDAKEGAGSTHVP